MSGRLWAKRGYIEYLIASRQFDSRNQFGVHLEKERGINRAYLTRLFDRKKNVERLELGKITAIAEELRVPLSAVIGGLDSSPWHLASWETPDALRNCNDLFYEAKNYLSIHRGIDSHLIPPEMRQAGMKKEIVPADLSKNDKKGVEDHLVGSYSYRELLRQHSDCHERIIAPQSFFRKHPNPEWIEDSIRRIKEQTGRTASGVSTISLLPDPIFADMAEWLSAVLCLRNWNKINMFDCHAATIVTGLETRITYDPNVVKQMLEVIESNLKNFASDMPLLSQANSWSNCARPSRESIGFLKKLQASAEKAQRSNSKKPRFT
ncbi:hypothetical protein Pan258_01670 [Symmachiella dynata]|uniref:hypothetical protein n=1 Tax=Symmachiella dynata TaxID=2527995 RepID=UPI001187AB7E|nr:hypothetical protein [Symmachiella dynata]QDT46150.1 hypothetical protein Pan258_01670 [Symmachiella dynata]